MLMGYLHQEHRCNLPLIQGDNDIWQCDDCKKIWRSYAPGNEDYNKWTPLGWFRRSLLEQKKWKEN